MGAAKNAVKGAFHFFEGIGNTALAPFGLADDPNLDVSKKPKERADLASLDPQRAAELGAARKRAAAGAGAANRSNFRVDLSSGDQGQTRGGLVIR